jgi:two-component system sensor kinase FixL
MSSSDQGRELLQLISEGFIFVDSDLRVLEINAVGLEMARRPRADFIGRHLWEVAPHLEDSDLGRIWVEAMRERAPVSAEHHYTWTDGRESWLEMRGHPTSGGLAIFYRDITEQKRSTEELKLAQSELMHASRLSAMGTMAATLAHELAQPLSAAASAIEASLRLLRPLPAAPAREARRGLHMASASVNRASEILKRLRSFVAKGQVEAEPQDLQALIADAAVLVFPQAQRAGVEISFHLDPRIRWVEADAVQVQQVLINLIKNAIEALDGAEERRITISTSAPAAGEVEIAVEDSGPGLEGKIEDAFAPFHSTKDGGLGLGLSISRTIIEAHGGTMEAGRSASGGALFRFTLPRVSAPV